MSAYVIVNVTIHQPDRYSEYRKMASEAVAAYGGRYLARGGEQDVLEGQLEAERVVILEFESLDKARAWHASDEYSEGKALRQAIATSTMYAVQGV